ncbi:MAG: hypothetical protein RDU89_11345 [bacterium]|nr:hypothetical protein [bacterium]
MRSFYTGETGAALVVTLLVAVVAVVALGTTAALAQGTVRTADRWRSEGAALYAAESGVNEALYRLKYEMAQIEERIYPSDPPSLTSDQGSVGSNAAYQVWVWADAADPTLHQIAALGSAGSARRLVRAAARPLEAYPWAPDEAGELVGGGGSGPAVEAPPDAINLGDFRIRGSNIVYLGSAGVTTNYVCNSINAGGEAKLVLLGPINIYVLGDITLSGEPQLNVVQVGTEWVGGDPRDLLIWVPGEIQIEIDLLGSAAFYGGIYAPWSTLEMKGDAYLEGAVRVGEVTLTGSPTYSYVEGMSGLLWPETAQLDRKVVAYE